VAVSSGRDDSKAQLGNLPPELTSFVGREELLKQALDLLEATKLLTLTGPGGAGKTRLALQVARRLQTPFPDGAWVVDLAQLSEPGLVDLTVAAALGLRDQSSRPGRDPLIRHLRRRRMLLVLDNCEHLVKAVEALASALITKAPGVRLIATSRRPLGVDGERVLPVPPLMLPGPDDGEFSAHSVLRSEAVTLLVDRAKAHNPLFAVTSSNWDAVVDLVTDLDGIPLAIELAAVRLRSLSVPQVVERLDDRFRLLKRDGGQAPDDSGRHHTLRAVVDWSHDLCSPAEQLLWARLSVFAADFDLAAVEAICTDQLLPTSDILDGLDSLVRQSVITADTTGGQASYHMLETLRQYGRDRLQERGNDEALRLQHMQYFRSVASRGAVDWAGPREVTWMHTLGGLLPEFRAALDYCLSHVGQEQAGAEIALALARSRMWFFGSTISEGLMWLLRAAGRLTEPSVLKACCLGMGAFMAVCQGSRAQAQALLEECQATIVGSRDSDKRVAVAVHTYVDGVIRWLSRDVRAVALLGKARELFAELEMRGEVVMAVTMMTMAAGHLSDERELALSIADSYLEAAEHMGGEWAISWSYFATAVVHHRYGDQGYALRLIRNSLRIQREIADQWGPVWNVLELAEIEAEQGRTENAALLVGASVKMQADTGVMVAQMGGFAQSLARAKELSRQDPAYNEAYRRGSSLSWDQILATAIGDSDQAPGHDALLGVFDGTNLSVREREVALLAADGLTNPEIAAQMYVSHRTVESHLRNARRKLGLRSRGQLAAWVAERLGSPAL
jgi:predicted ATPase/DNA-binding CsgD family transcriptional regulator